MRGNLRLWAGLGLMLLLAAGPAVAVPCALDDVPAATLLLPYFEVDLDSPSGATTLLSINNAADESVLTQITFWTDLGVPTLYYNIQLTGYDVVTINLRDFLVRGQVPVTGPGVVPPGLLSMPDLEFPNCAGFLPLPFQLPAPFLTFLQQSHTGEPVTAAGGERCAVGTGDRIARGYVTIDVVRSCSLLSPSSAEYYDSVIGFDNVLWGEFFLVDPASGRAQGDNLVRIEAAPEMFGDGDLTFYGRYVGYDGRDGREPLPTVWATRFLNSIGDRGSDLLVWRDTQTAQQDLDCDPEDFPWFPLRSFPGSGVIFDEEENAQLLSPGCLITPCPPSFYPAPFPAATQRVAVGTNDLETDFEFGWMWLGFDHSGGPLPSQEFRAQAWVGSLMDAAGDFSAGFAGSPVHPPCAEAPSLPVTRVPAASRAESDVEVER